MSLLFALLYLFKSFFRSLKFSILILELTVFFLKPSILCLKFLNSLAQFIKLFV